MSNNIGFDPADLDKSYQQRFRELWRKDGVSPNEIFLHEDVASGITKEKIILQGFDRDRILALLPFAPQLYVEICRFCLRDASELSAFKILVKRKAIIPILGSPYKFFRADVNDAIRGQQHVSSHEFFFYRTARLGAMFDGGVCRHCLKKSEKAALELARNYTDAKQYRETVKVIVANLFPYVRPDVELLDVLLGIARSDSLDALAQLRHLSFGIREIRTSQALDAPTLISAKDISALPSGVLSTKDQIRRSSVEVSKYVSDGLGLRIPTDVPLENYIEIVKDYGPAIHKIVGAVASRANSGAVSFSAVEAEVAKINREVDRIKGLRRYAILEAGIEFWKSRSTFIATSLIVSALGAIDGLAGCAVGAGVQTVRLGAKYIRSKRGTKEPSPALNRLKKIAKRDLREPIDKVVAMYANGQTLAANVISLRKVLSEKAES